MLKKYQFSTFRPSNQSFCSVFLVLAAFSITTATVAEEPFDVAVRYTRGDLHQFSAQIEHRGEVIIDNAGEGEEAQTLPLKVDAKINFEQRFTGSPDNLQAIRKYQNASAEINIDDGNTRSELSNENKLIVVRIQPSSPQRMQLASVSEILQQKELELIRNPADPLTFVRLFSNNGVKTGDRWKASSESVADFLAVDHVYENEIELQLKSVNKNFAKVYVVGKAKAEIDDVTTEIEVSGVSLIDLQKNLLTAMRVTIREDRSPGQIAPGFKGQTKINVKMTATETVPELSDEALAVTKSKQIQRMLKWSSDQADFRITYHPRWRVIASESEAVVLRYLDDGDVLAQCNIVQLPARPADNPLKLEDFKAEVEKIVAGEDSASVLSSQEFKTNAGLTALRVQVEGLESTVPIIWTYYHVAGKDGRCLTYVFTLEQRVADRFANADQLLVDETVFKHVIETAKSDKSRSASQTDSKPRR